MILWRGLGVCGVSEEEEGEEKEEEAEEEEEEDAPAIKRCYRDLLVLAGVFVSCWALA